LALKKSICMALRFIFSKCRFRLTQYNVLVIHGLPEAFCAGADEKNLIAPGNGTVQVKDLAVSRRLLEAPFLVIAAREGCAIGGRLMTAACCDIFLDAKESR
jgi:enoyl-CoA hydratase/carnithine racemase